MISFAAQSLVALVLLSCVSTVSQAQSRTFVSSFGTDANACSIAAPCRTLQRGIDAVAAGGDVLIVDSGGFGTNVLITKSVSVIAAPGAQARLAVSAGSTAVAINGSGISVALSGFGITGQGSASAGVKFLGGTSVSLSDMDINISGSNTFAVIHEAAGGHLTIAGTQLRNSTHCFLAAGQSGSLARATIVNTRGEGCVLGIRASDYSTVSIESSVVSGNIATCVYGFYATNTQATMTLDKVVASHCGYGIYSDSEATISVSNSLISGNTNAGGVDTTIGGIGRTYGNNRVFGNGVDTLSGFTSISEQ